MRPPSTRPRSAFGRVSSVVVAVRGIGGLVELVRGLLLLVAPGTAAQALGAVLLVAQLVDVIASPGVGGWVLVVLDAVVLALVLDEYRHLRARTVGPARQPDRVVAP